MIEQYYAHTLPDLLPEEWHHLDEHLKNTAVFVG